jgi:hypothetical protein
MMLDFLDRFQSVVADWPEGEKLSFHELAIRTRTPIPHVIEIICMGLSKNLEVHDAISRKDADNTINNLKHKLRFEIEAQERRKASQREKADDAYKRTMEKVAEKMRDKNAYSAYRTLSYFAGIQEEFLCRETMISVCNDCLRIGFKAGVNKQELASWLQKGVKLCLSADHEESVEDAKDLIETYGDDFASDGDAKMAAFIEGMKAMINKIISPVTEPVTYAGMSMTETIIVAPMDDFQDEFDNTDE